VWWGQDVERAGRGRVCSPPPVLRRPAPRAANNNATHSLYASSSPGRWWRTRTASAARGAGGGRGGGGCGELCHASAPTHHTARQPTTHEAARLQRLVVQHGGIERDALQHDVQAARRREVVGRKRASWSREDAARSRVPGRHRAAKRSMWAAAWHHTRQRRGIFAAPPPAAAARALCSVALGHGRHGDSALLDVAGRAPARRARLSPVGLLALGSALPHDVRGRHGCGPAQPRGARAHTVPVVSYSWRQLRVPRLPSDAIVGRPAALNA
jgi:hypothetical protein